MITPFRWLERLYSLGSLSPTLQSSVAEGSSRLSNCHLSQIPHKIELAPQAPPWSSSHTQQCWSGASGILKRFQAH